MTGKLIRVALLAGLATVGAGTAAAAGFTGAAAPGNFTVSDTGTLVGSPVSSGTALFSAIQLVLLGSNAAGGCSGGTYAVLSSPCQLQVTISLPGSYRFDWSYVSADADGPAGDIFGVIVDGNRIGLSDPGGAIAQSGTSTFAATSSFGWILNCTDCQGGFATATISGFTLTPVPEPAAWALLLGGVTALRLARRRV